MAHLCSLHGWTVAEVELVDVGDELLLLCPDCRDDVLDQDESAAVTVGDF